MKDFFFNGYDSFKKQHYAVHAVFWFFIGSIMTILLS